MAGSSAAEAAPASQKRPVRSERSGVTSGLRDALLGLRNADGGWGYYPGKTSRLEPTCWALLALARQSGAPVEIGPLQKWPRDAGWLVDAKGAPANFAFNALAALTLLEHPDGKAGAVPVALQLVRTRGVRLEQATALRQDNSLQAWPWIDQTFSWVEPTAWCLLLLKKLRKDMPPEVIDRIRVGEQMLLDRACKTGGWNYGGSNVYGQELWAYVPTTALALLAMQDHKDDPTVARSLEYLRKDTGTERSAPALALAVVCLRVFGVDVAPFEQDLVSKLDLSRAMGSTVALASSLYALAETRHGMAPFVL